MNITKRHRLVLGGVFFALMLGHFGVNAYSAWMDLMARAKSSDGWTARLSPDGRAQIVSVDKDGPATALRVGDEVLSINGLSLRDNPEILSYNQSVAPGTSYTIVVRRQGQSLEFTLKTIGYPISRWLIPIVDSLIQLLFLLIGLTVFLLKPADRHAWLLALLLGAFTGLFNNELPPLPLVVTLMMAVARIIGVWSLPLFCQFFLIFPDRSPLLRRFPNLERRLYWPFYLSLPWFSFTRLIVVFRRREEWAQFLRESWLFQSLDQQWVALSSLGIGMAYLAFGLAALFVSYRVADGAARRKLHVLVAGSGAGFLNLLLVIMWESFLRRRLPDTGGWIRGSLGITLPLIPLSFAYAIIRHQVIPVSLIIRRSARYVLVSRGAVVLDLIAVGLSVTAVLTYFFNRTRPPVIVIGLVSAAVGIGTWKIAGVLHDRYLRPLIDRHFFRQSYDAHQIIAELTGALRGVTDLPQLLELVATKLRTALQTEYVTIYLRDSSTGSFDNAYSCDYCGANGAAGAGLRGGQLARYAMMVDQLDQLGKSLGEAEPRANGRRADEIELDAFLSGYDIDATPDAKRETLREAKSTLLMPLYSKDGILGVISLGPRLGDLPFSREDKQLLMSVSGPTALAVENSRLVERMVEEARRRKEIEAENDQRAKELEEARQLQLSMLPKKMPQSPHLEIDAYMKPAAEVGGDYYDFHQSDNGVLTVVVGDATGHGLKAGTVVTAMKSLFRTYASEDDLSLVFNQSSRVLKEMNLRSLFMSLTMVKLDGARLRIASAGMPPALIYRAEKGLVEEMVIKAPPLGGISGYQYREREYELGHGDVLVLMSDGFPERFNQDGEMFDYSRARRSLAEAASRRPSEIIEHFVRDGDYWANGRPQNDDITFVVLKVK
jgi:serine phosphatase RsbU (regulator of sigma subunit)